MLRLNETGLLLVIKQLTTDAYGTVIIEYQGADLETRSIQLYPEATRVLGAFAQDPAGWMQRYSRPNPYSTSGIYLQAVTNAFQGFPMAFVPTVVVKLYLPENSTQASAYINGTAATIAITDKENFIRSLRAVANINTNLISPGLLATGPAVVQNYGLIEKLDVLTKELTRLVDILERKVEA